MRRFAVFAALAFAALPALADVDVEVRNGDIVSGTLNPATETETFRVQVPAGAKLSATVIGKPLAKKQQKPPLALRLLDGADGVVAQSDGGAVKPKAKLKGIVIPASGEYRVVVTGDGATAGNYTLKIKWKQVKRVKIDKQTLNGPLQIPFAAEDGTFVTALIKATKGSTALPRLVQITNTGTAAEVTPDPPSDGADKKHKIKAQELPGGGDFTLDIGNDGTAGEVSGKITLKAPKPTKTKVGVTAESLGTEVTDGVARGKVFGKEGGKLTIDVSVSALIAGAGLDVPPGALSSPTALVIGTAPPVKPADETTEAAGPTVSFGPSGQTFGVEVTVTIPFTGSSAGVFVVESDAKGNETIITADLTFDPAGTVSVKTTHFTRYRAFRPAGAAAAKGDLDGDGIADLVLRAPEDTLQTGIVYIVFGPVTAGFSTASLPADTTTIVGDAPTVNFGVSPILVADLNGDGVAELIIPGDAGGGGHIHIYTGIQRGQNLIETQRTAAIFGQIGDVNFGAELAAGDINGDGQVDLLVGAEDANGSRGAAYAFFGDSQAPFPFSDTDSSVSFIRWDGVNPGDLLGAQLAIGDVTGNGSNDVVLAYDQQSVPGASGEVLIYQGPLDGVTRFFRPQDADVRISGEFVGDAFGSPVQLGDFDGDGQLDLVTAAAGHDNGGSPTDDVGSVYVFFGGPGILSATSAEDRAAQVFAIAPGDELGENMVVGDVTADGIDDILVTAPGDDAPNADNGAVWIYPGSTTRSNVLTVSALLHGEAAGDGIKNLLPPVDLDGDGNTDLIAAAETNSTAGANAGAYYVVFGRNPFTFPVNTLISAEATSTTGFTVRGVANQFLGGDND